MEHATLELYTTALKKSIQILFYKSRKFIFINIRKITVIGGKELLYTAKAVGAKTYSVTFPYLGAAAMYLVVVIILAWLQGKLERRLRQSDRR